MMKIEGKIKIKKDLVGTIPRDWKLCKEDFSHIVKSMRCCVEGCPDCASLYEISPARKTMVKTKPDCAHSQLCVLHAQKYSELADKKPIKREPVAPTEKMMPPTKKQADDEDTVTETNDDNSDTSTEVHNEDVKDEKPKEISQQQIPEKEDVQKDVEIKRESIDYPVKEVIESRQMEEDPIPEKKAEQTEAKEERKSETDLVKVEPKEKDVK